MGSELLPYFISFTIAQVKAAVKKTAFHNFFTKKLKNPIDKGVVW